MTDLQLLSEETCVEWCVKWVLLRLEGCEVTEDTIHFVSEEVMRDWDLYCGRDYPKLPELTDSQWEGCLDSVRTLVEDKLGL